MKQNSISNILRIAALLAAILCLAVFGMAGAETTIEVKDISETVIPEADNLNGEDPAAQYIYKTLGWDEMYKAPTPAFRGSTAGERLTGWAKMFYDDLKIKIAAVADGTERSTVFTWQLTEMFNQEGGYDVTELGMEGITCSEDLDAAWDALSDDMWTSIPSAVDALLLDCPYEFYWFDKKVGYEPRIQAGYGTRDGLHLIINSGTLSISFTIAEAYQAKNESNPYKMTDVAAAITTAKANAQAILAGAASKKTAYQKMLYFKDRICEETDYNHDAADDDSTPYGDPWQLIYVFDGNDETNVVCEGYSKAFQYLCDQSGLDAISVSGTMSGGTGSGRHMWNIATIDGAHYLVDVTNSDDGTIGSIGGLFMDGYEFKDGNTYTYGVFPFNGVTYGYEPIDYTYNQETIATLGSSGKLNLSKDPYYEVEWTVCNELGDEITSVDTDVPFTLKAKYYGPPCYSTYFTVTQSGFDSITCDIPDADGVYTMEYTAMTSKEPIKMSLMAELPSRPYDYWGYKYFNDIIPINEGKALPQPDLTVISGQIVDDSSPLSFILKTGEEPNPGEDYSGVRYDLILVPESYGLTQVNIGTFNPDEDAQTVSASAIRDLGAAAYEKYTLKLRAHGTGFDGQTISTGTALYIAGAQDPDYNFTISIAGMQDGTMQINPGDPYTITVNHPEGIGSMEIRNVWNMWPAYDLEPTGTTTEIAQYATSGALPEFLMVARYTRNGNTYYSNPLFVTYARVNCAHENAVRLPIITGNVRTLETSGDDAVHRIIGSGYWDIRCYECGYQEYEDCDELEDTRSHSYNGDEVCDECGHVCTHTELRSTGICNSNSVSVWQSPSAHQTVQVLTGPAMCAHCGKSVNEQYIETQFQTRTVENHEFDENGVCTECGGKQTDNWTWEMDMDVLTISGTGAIPDFTSGDDTPWKKLGYREIRQVVIEEGISGIGKNVFANMPGTVLFDLNETTAPTVDATAFAGTDAVCRYYGDWTAPAGNSAIWLKLPEALRNREFSGTLIWDGKWEYSYYSKEDNLSGRFELSAAAAKYLTRERRDVTLMSIPTENEDLSVINASDVTDSMFITFAGSYENETENYILTIPASVKDSVWISINQYAPGLNLTVSDLRTGERRDLSRVDVHAGSVTISEPVESLIVSNSGTATLSVTVNGDVTSLTLMDASAATAVTISGKADTVYFYSTGSGHAYLGDVTVKGAVQKGVRYGIGENVTITGIGTVNSIPGMADAEFTKEAQENDQEMIKAGVLQIASTPVDTLTEGMLQFTFICNGSEGTDRWSLSLRSKQDGHALCDIELDPSFTTDNIIWGDDTEIIIRSVNNPITLNGSTDGKGFGWLDVYGSSVTINCPVKELSVNNSDNTSTIEINSKVDHCQIRTKNTDDTIVLGENGIISQGYWYRKSYSFREFGPATGSKTGKTVFVQGSLRVMSWKLGEETRIIMPTDADLAEALPATQSGKSASMEVQDKAVSNDKKDLIRSEMLNSSDAIHRAFDVSVSADGTAVSQLEKNVTISVNNDTKERAYIVRLHDDGTGVRAERLTDPTSSSVIDFVSDRFSEYVIVKCDKTTPDIRAAGPEIYEWNENAAAEDGYEFTITAAEGIPTEKTVRWELRLAEIEENETNHNESTVYTCSKAGWQPSFTIPQSVLTAKRQYIAYLTIQINDYETWYSSVPFVACDHSETETGYEWEPGSVYSQKDKKTHTHSGLAHELTVCSFCGKTLAREEEATSKEIDEPHTCDEGVCVYCGCDTNPAITVTAPQIYTLTGQDGAGYTLGISTTDEELSGSTPVEWELTLYEYNGGFQLWHTSGTGWQGTLTVPESWEAGDYYSEGELTNRKQYSVILSINAPDYNGYIDTFNFVVVPAGSSDISIVLKDEEGNVPDEYYIETDYYLTVTAPASVNAVSFWNYAGKDWDYGHWDYQYGNVYTTTIRLNRGINTFLTAGSTNVIDQDAFEAASDEGREQMGNWSLAGRPREVNALPKGQLDAPELTLSDGPYARGAEFTATLTKKVNLAEEYWLIVEQAGGAKRTLFYNRLEDTGLSFPVTFTVQTDFLDAGEYNVYIKAMAAGYDESRSAYTKITLSENASVPRTGVSVTPYNPTAGQLAYIYAYSMDARDMFQILIDRIDENGQEISVYNTWVQERYLYPSICFDSPGLYRITLCSYDSMTGVSSALTEPTYITVEGYVEPEYPSITVNAPKGYVLTGTNGAGYPITLRIPEDADYTDKTVNWSLAVYPFNSYSEADIVYSTSGTTWPDALTITIPEKVEETAILAGRQEYSIALTISVEGYNPYTPYDPLSFTVFDKDSVSSLTVKLTDENEDVTEPYLINKDYTLSVEGGENVTALYIWNGSDWQPSYGNNYSMPRNFTVPGRTEFISVYATTDPIDDGVDYDSLNWSLNKTLQIIPQMIGDGELEGMPAVTLDDSSGTYTRWDTATAQVNTIEAATDYQLQIWPMNNGMPDYNGMNSYGMHLETDGTEGETLTFSIPTAHMPAGEYCVYVNVSAPGYYSKQSQSVTMTITGDEPAYVLNVPASAVCGETVPIYAFAPYDTFELRIERQDENGNTFYEGGQGNWGNMYIQYSQVMMNSGTYIVSLYGGSSETAIVTAQMTVTSEGNLSEVEIDGLEPWFPNNSALNLYLVREAEMKAEKYNFTLMYSPDYNGSSYSTVQQVQLKPSGSGRKIPLTIPASQISEPGMYIINVMSSAYGWAGVYTSRSFIVLDAAAMEQTSRLSLLDATGKPTSVTDYMIGDTVYPKIDCTGASSVRFWDGYFWHTPVIKDGVALPDSIYLYDERDRALIAEVTVGEGDEARTLLSALAIHVHERTLPSPAFTVAPDVTTETVTRGDLITVTIGDDPEGEGSLGGPFTYYANILENKGTGYEDWVVVRRAEMDGATRIIRIATDDLTNTADGIYALEIGISNGQTTDGKSAPTVFTVTEPETAPAAFRVLRSGSPVDTDTNQLMINETAEAVAYLPGAARLAVTVTPTGNSEETVFEAAGEIGIWAWTPAQQGTYTLTLRAEKEDGTEVPNLPGAITVTVGTYGTLEPTEITSPADGAAHSAGTELTVDYNAVTGATDYLVILSYNQGDDENPLWQEVTEVSATGLSATISGDKLARFGSYSVQVQANAPGYESSLSEPVGFQVSGQSNIGFEFANTDICTLIITGNGETGDFDSYTDTPWYQYAEENGIDYSGISRIIVESGVTGLGKNALAGFDGTVRVDFKESARPRVDAGVLGGGSAVFRYYDNTYSEESWSAPAVTGAQWIYLPFDPGNEAWELRYVADNGTGNAGWVVGERSFSLQNYSTVDWKQAKEITYDDRWIYFDVLPAEDSQDVNVYASLDAPTRIYFTSNCHGTFTLNFNNVNQAYRNNLKEIRSFAHNMASNQPLNLTVTGPAGGKITSLQIHDGGTIVYNGDVQTLDLSSTQNGNGVSLTVNGNIDSLNFYNANSKFPYKGTLTLGAGKTVAEATEYGENGLYVPGICADEDQIVLIQNLAEKTYANLTDTNLIQRVLSDVTGEYETRLVTSQTSGDVTPTLDQYRLSYFFEAQGKVVFALIPKNETDLGNHAAQIDDVRAKYNPNFSEEYIIWGDDTTVYVQNAGTAEENKRTFSQGIVLTGSQADGFGTLYLENANVSIQCHVGSVIVWERANSKGSVKAAVEKGGKVDDLTLFLNKRDSDGVFSVAAGSEVSGGGWNRGIRGTRPFGKITGVATIAQNGQLTVLTAKSGQTTMAILPADGLVTDYADVLDGYIASLDINDSSIQDLYTEEETALDSYLESKGIHRGYIESVFDATVHEYYLNGDETGASLSEGGSISKLNGAVDITVAAGAGTTILRLHNENGTVESAEMENTSQTEGRYTFASDSFSKYLIISNHSVCDHEFDGYGRCGLCGYECTHIDVEPTENGDHICDVCGIWMDEATRWDSSWGIGTDSNGETVLYLNGCGNMPDYSTATPPWAGNQISRIVISEDITRIGKNAFAGMEGTVRVEFIGTTRTMPAIDAGAFTGTTAICRYYSQDTSWAGAPALTNVKWVYLPQYEETPGKLPITYGDPDGSGSSEPCWYLGIESGNYLLSQDQAEELTYIHRDLTFEVLPDINGDDAKLFTPGIRRGMPYSS